MRLEQNIGLPKHLVQNQCAIAVQPRRRCSCERQVWNSLWDLHSQFYSIHDWYNWQNADPSKIAKECYRAGVKKCIEDDLISPDGLPVRLTLSLTSGTRRRATLLGLPRIKQETRIAAARWEKNGKIPRQNVTRQPYILESREDGTNAVMRCPGQSKRAQRSIEAARRNFDEEAAREERRAQREKRTAQSERKARRTAYKDLRRSTREQQEDKKAGKKRLGRKATSCA